MNIGNNFICSENAKIDNSVTISNNVIIENDVVIGENVFIGNNVIIHSGTIIKSNCNILDNTILGRVPAATGSVERIVDNNLPALFIDSGCVIGVAAVIYRGTHIGKNVLIADNASIREQCIIEDDCIISRGVTINYSTSIGKRTKIMDLTHITGDMIIENDVFISVGVTSTNDNSMGRQSYDKTHVKGPIIRKFATIGGGACLLPGVEIGENSIIGMGAVVSKNIPSKKVAMGIPAKVIKDVPEELLKR